MDKLHLFLKAWKELKDPEAMLHRGLTLPAAPEVQRTLEAKNDQERQEILALLEEVEGAFARFANDLALKSKEAKEQIEQSRQAQSACLKYTNILGAADDKKKR